MKDKPTILYVDQEVHNINSFLAIFRKDYQVISAGSAQQGFIMLEMHPVEIIVCSKRLTEMDGVTFLTATMDNYPNISRLLMSGYKNDVSENKAIVYEYLVIPWNEADLKSIIKGAHELFLINKDLAANRAFRS